MDSPPMLEDPGNTGWMRRCIVIAPTVDYEAWLAAIYLGAAPSELEIVVVHGEDVGPVEGEDRRVFLSTNAKFLEPAHDADVAAIATNTGGAIYKTAQLTGADEVSLYTVMDASELLTSALLLPNAKVITNRLVGAEGQTLELLPGLNVERPAFGSHTPDWGVERAGVKALAIFAEGVPPVGSEAELDRDIFFYDGRKQEIRERITLMDITGRPRMLVNGPQITLPAGEWEVTADFTVDEDGADYRLAVEWGPVDETTTFEIQPGRPGLFRVSLSHVWTAPARAELRIRLTEGALAGEFEFLGAKMRRTR